MGRRVICRVMRAALLAIACAHPVPDDGLPPRRSDVAGLITQVQAGTAGPRVIFVEMNPSDAARIGSGTPKANIGIDSCTRVLRRAPEGGYVPADRRELRLGSIVRVWYAEPPVAGAARPGAPAAVVVLMPTFEPEPPRP